MTTELILVGGGLAIAPQVCYAGGLAEVTALLNTISDNEALSRAGGVKALETIIAKTSASDAKVQEAAVQALELPLSYYDRLRDDYTRKRDLFLGYLDEAGLRYTKPQGAYYVMAAFYVVALYTLTRIPKTGRGERSSTSVWADLWEGVRYMGAHASLPSLLGLTMVWTLLGMSYRTFMPKYAQDVMGMDASGLGILMAAPGVGGLISSLVTASLGDFRGKGRLLMIAGLGFGVSLIAFANVP